MSWWMAAPALLGAIAGAQGSGGKSRTDSVNVGPESELERIARLQQTQGFGQLDRIQREDFSRANQASQSYGDLLKQYQQTGGMPSQADLAQGRSFAEQALAPQQAQINLAMRQATEASQRQAGLSGRGPNDFALNIRLAGQRADLMTQLGAQQSALGLQQAQQISQNRLGYAGQYADLQQGLATQAMQNRMAIMSLGSNIQSAGQNFRANTATRTTSQPGSPGGLMGALTGAFTGAQAGTGLMRAFNGMSSTGTNDNNSDIMGKINQGFASGQQFSNIALGSSAQGAAPNYSLGANFGSTPASSFSPSSNINRAPAASAFPTSYPPLPANNIYQAPSFNVMQPNALTPMGLGAGSSFGAPEFMYPYQYSYSR